VTKKTWTGFAVGVTAALLTVSAAILWGAWANQRSIAKLRDAAAICAAHGRPDLSFGFGLVLATKLEVPTRPYPKVSRTKSREMAADFMRIACGVPAEDD